MENENPNKSELDERVNEYFDEVKKSVRREISFSEMNEIKRAFRSGAEWENQKKMDKTLIHN